MTTLIGYAESQEAFDLVFEKTKQEMCRLHCIFDAYNSYDGLKNLCYVNLHAAEGPVEAEPELFDLLVFAKSMYGQTKGRVNIAMGSVLKIWHEYREKGTEVPPVSLLEQMNRHTSPDRLILDENAGTVFFEDDGLQLDLGAVAKGYAVEKVSDELLSKEMPSFILNAGGNVRCGAAPRDGRKRWGVAIQDATGGNSYQDVLYMNSLSAVTSGDYQRFYEVDGIRYHHLIDPDTLMPGNHLHAITVVTDDSGYADILSTALFLMPYEEGRELVDSLDNVEAYWVLPDYRIAFTDGLSDMLGSMGANAGK